MEAFTEWVKLLPFSRLFGLNSALHYYGKAGRITEEGIHTFTIFGAVPYAGREN
jgi:hypothetical protein